MPLLRTSRNKTAGPATEDAVETIAVAEGSSTRRRRIISRILAAGFLFFLIKGIVWLVIGGAAVAGILKASGGSS